MWYAGVVWILALIFVVPAVFLWIAFQIVRFLVWMLVAFAVEVRDWLEAHRAAPSC